VAGDDRGADLARPGLPVYQPATEVLAGTCRMPRAVRPSLISRGADADDRDGQIHRAGHCGPGGRPGRWDHHHGEQAAAEQGRRHRVAYRPGETPSLAGVAWPRRQLRVPSRPSGQGTPYPTLSTVRRVVIRTVSRDARK
jgi:hypothetical protein